MKTTIGLMLLCAAGFASAEDAAQPGTTEPAMAQEQVRTEEQATLRKSVRRQGADMRHCLKLKDNAAIIRCAEPGRKP